MPRVYSIDGITPVVDPSAYVHPSAVLIGDVIVAARAYIGPCAVLPAAKPGRRHPRARVAHPERAELRWKKDNMLLYQDLARRSASSMQEVEALTAVEPDRRRIDIRGAVPLSELKAANR